MKIAICAIIKDEHRYLDEWLQYHLNLGFDEIWLYEDFGSLSHKDICKKYDNVIINSMELFESHRINPKRQTILYKWFLEKYRDNYDWITFIDIDEFITLDKGLNLKDVLNEYREQKGLFMAWKLYNANNLIEPPKDYKVLDTYKEYVKNYKVDIIRIKSFVNTKNNGKLKTHHWVEDGVTPLLDKEASKCTYDKIWINHYYTKSWTEWLLKIFERGNLYFGLQKILDFFKYNPDMKEKLPELLSKMGSLVRKYK